MSILSLVKHAPKITSAIFIMIVTAIIVPLTLHAWGPSRTTYTVESPATKITFNSITNNPVVGDERNFVVVKDAANTADGGWQDNITAQPGKEYLVRVYVHNNAASSLNLTATNTRVSASVPTTTGKSVSISGFVSANNSDPLQVWDDIHFNSDKDFNLAYVAGSAQIWNNGYATAGQPLSDSIVTSSGALIGYNGPDGNVPGCFQYSNYVYFKVRPQFAPTDKFETTKQVRKAGTTTWSKSVNVNPGDNLEYQITYKNAGEINEYDVDIKDTLPAGISYIPGSTVLTNTNNPTGKTVNDDLFTSLGINIGSYKPGSIAYLRFSAKVNSNLELACGLNTFVNKERTIVNGGYIEDTANAVVNKTCTQECKPGIPVGDVRCNPPKECKPGIPVGDARCTTTPPPELPHTGPTENIVAFLGLGALIASIAYYVASRRVRA